jgi:ABC-type transport system involved in resistance to organic solvents, periplasmic component
MSMGANYFRIGLFVITAVVVAVVAIVLFGGGGFLRDEVIIETYINESVQGLDVGSPVKFLGVRLGTVEGIDFVRSEYRLDPKDKNFFRYERYVLVKFAVRLKMLKEITGAKVEPALERLIEQGLRIHLAPQGLTGVAYLEVSYVDPKLHRALPISWTPKHYYIPSVPSTLSRVTQSLDKVLGELEAVKAVQVQRLQEEALELLVELRKTVQRIKEVAEKPEMAEILTRLSQASQRFSTAAGRLDALLEGDEWQTTLKNAAQISEQLKSATYDLPDTMALLHRSLRRVDTLVSGQQDNIETTLANIRLISTYLKELSDNAEKYPAQLLFGKPPARTNPAQ